MRVHALVADAETARAAAEGGATVIQLRLKNAPTAEIVELGRELEGLGPQLVVNDDVEAALVLGCGVHLGQNDPGAERAAAAGLLLGISARTRREAAVAEYAGASYVGAGPIWSTPSKPDAGEPIGLDGSPRGLSCRLRSGRGDRRDRFDERGRVHPRGCVGRRRHPGHRRAPCRARGDRCGSLRPASSGSWASSSGAG
jgi:hypothetical protein